MAVRSRSFLCSRSKRLFSSSLLQKLRFCRASSSVVSSKEERTALDMIKYAKSLKLDEPSYSEAVRVLEQGLSFFSGDGLPSSMATGRLQLCLATIHADRSNYEAAAECLHNLINTRTMPLEIKGLAIEALTCLCLQLRHDDEALIQADRLTSLLEEENVHMEQLQSMRISSLALKKLVEMANRSFHLELQDPSSFLDSENASGRAVLDIAEFSHLCGSLLIAKPMYEKAINISKRELDLPATISTRKCCISGRAVLDIAEFSHVCGSLSIAKSMYEKAIYISKRELEENGEVLSAIATAPEAVQITAKAGLGQLLTSMRDFEEAELHLTEALKLAEKSKGEKHPQVGAILSCVGNLYQEKARVEGRSEVLITEGVYKSALDLMKAQPLDREIVRDQHYADIIALTRVRLGIALAPMSKRRSEVEKLKCAAEAIWCKSQPLPEFEYLKYLLESDNNNEKQETVAQGSTVVDIRLGRVFYK